MSYKYYNKVWYHEPYHRTSYSTVVLYSITFTSRLTFVTIQVEFLWVVTPCSVVLLRNHGIL